MRCELQEPPLAWLRVRAEPAKQWGMGTVPINTLARLQGWPMPWKLNMWDVKTKCKGP